MNNFKSISKLIMCLLNFYFNTYAQYNMQSQTTYSLYLIDNLNVIFIELDQNKLSL